MVRTLARELPEEVTVFVGSSMAIRDVDSFWPAAGPGQRFLGNRGASGIDGLVSTGLGIAAVTAEPTVLLLGDLSLYHDMNGLWAAKRHGVRAVIVVLDNNGGGIFDFLPAAAHRDVFEEVFATPLDRRRRSGGPTAPAPAVAGRRPDHPHLRQVPPHHQRQGPPGLLGGRGRSRPVGARLASPSLYARHGQSLEGESPLEEEVVLTPSQRQRLRREAGREEARGETLHRGTRVGSCTGGRSRRRPGQLGEPATDGEARHHQQAGQVDARE